MLEVTDNRSGIADSHLANSEGFGLSSPALAGEADGLVGVWKLLSWQVIVDDEPPIDVFGPHPKGHLVLTREGRGIVLTTAENRKSGMGDAERAALHKSMLAYSDKYRA